MKVIISHPTGNANVRAAAKGLLNAGFLKEFHTTIANFPGTILSRVARIPMFGELSRRSYDPLLRNYTRSHPLMEAARMIAPKVGFKKLTASEFGRFSIDAIYSDLDKKIAKRINKLSSEVELYAYEDGAYHSFRVAKEKNITCIYDLPIGYWRAARRLLKDEALERPEWAATITGLKDSEEKLKRKDEELRLADLILVASSFTASTLKYYPGKLAPIKVIPYGFPEVTTEKSYEKLTGRKLKLLFVGSLSQRKGIANLFEAVDGLNNSIELTVVGKKPVDNCAILNKCLLNCNWIPSLSHKEILTLMRSQDVFVFPSLFEGFGLVITEAMSQGTPVITTDRTAGADLITHNENGWMIPAGSTVALRNTLEQILSKPELVETFGKAALRTASLRPWSEYGKELAKAINNN